MPADAANPTARFAGRVSRLGLAPAPHPTPRTLHLGSDPVILFWWLSATGCLIAVGAVKAINLLLLLGYGLLTLIVVNGLSARAAVRRVTGTRIPAGPCYAGETAGLAADVANLHRRPANVTVTDAAGGRRSAWLFAPLAPGTVHRLTAGPVFARRGVYPVGPLLAESGYPFGVVRVTARLAPDTVVAVLPAPGRVDRAVLRRWLIRGGGGDGRTRRTLARPTPGTGDVRGLRPFRPGDGLRDVHWRSSARRGGLLVREYDHPDPLDLVVVLDPYLPADPTPDEVARFEWAVGLAMSLGAAWADGAEDVTITLVVPSNPPVMAAAPADARAVRAAFAPLASVVGRPDVPAAVTPPGRDRKAVHLLCTPRGVSPVAASWRAAGRPVAVAQAGDPPAWYTPSAERGTGNAERDPGAGGAGTGSDIPRSAFLGPG